MVEHVEPLGDAGMHAVALLGEQHASVKVLEAGHHAVCNRTFLEDDFLTHKLLVVLDFLNGVLLRGRFEVLVNKVVSNAFGSLKILHSGLSQICNYNIEIIK